MQSDSVVRDGTVYLFISKLIVEFCCFSSINMNNVFFMSNVKKWVPAIKEQWVVVITNVEPRVKTLTTKTVEIYEVSKKAVTPHVIKAQELADPYYQVRYILINLAYISSYALQA